MAVNLHTHKLIAMAALDDGLGALLSKNAGEAFWRGFLIQDRATGVYTFKYRFNYKGPAGRSWTEIEFVKPRESLDALMEEIRTKMGETLVGIASVIVAPLPCDSADVFQWHVVPEADREDGNRTLIWMEMHDLVNPPRFEKKEVPSES